MIMRNKSQRKEDPCALLDKALECNDPKESVRIFWQVAQTNIAMIPRLLLWEEIQVPGNEAEQNEAWFYMNTRWKKWKKSEAFIALSIFWSHWSIRHALGLPLIKKMDVEGKPDFGKVVVDIAEVLDGKTLKGKVAKKAAKVSLNFARILRYIDRKKIKPTEEMKEELADTSIFSKNILELYSIESAGDGALLRLSGILDEMEDIQKRVFWQAKGKSSKFQSQQDVSYVG